MAEAATTPRLLERYHESVVPQLKERFNYKNSMEVPRLVKVKMVNQFLQIVI